MSGFNERFGKASGDKQYAKADIPDGEYEVSIKSAVMREGTKSGDVFSFKFTILSPEVVSGKKTGGKTIEKAIFLETQKGTEEERDAYADKKAAELKADLNVIGFNVKEWENPLAMLAIACDLMIDVNLKIAVKTNGDYQNVYINKRLATDGKPARFGAAEMQAVANHDFSGGQSLDDENPAPTGSDTAGSW